ncbi:MAG: hypothetical protein ACE5J4_00975 [Candidatus Aenigmatarchaeota archaeon]
MVKIDFTRVLSAALASSAMAIYVTFIFSLFSEISKVEAIYSIIIGIVFLLVMPFLPLYYYKEYGYTDWDVTDRKKRPKLYGFKILGGFIATILFYLINNMLMFKYSLIFSIVMIFLLLINYYSKISLHSAGVTMGTLSLYLVYGGYSIISLILIPVVCLIRLKMKAHSIIQLIAGILVSGIITFIIYSI